MSNVQGSVIQGYFPGGRPRIPVAPMVQLRAAGPQTAQPRLAPPNRLPAPPRQPERPVVQRFANGPATLLPASLANFGHGGQRLPEALQKKMETVFRTSFSDVRVHVGRQAESIGARAFTHGSNIYFAPGQYDPQTPHGQQLLGHELTHVVQQRAGRVRNPFGTGIAVVQDPLMEIEADRMGLRAAAWDRTVQARPARPPLRAPQPVRPNGPARHVAAVQLKRSGGVIQRVVEYQGYFNPQNEPEVEDDDSYFQFSDFEDLQEGLKLYETGDSSLGDLGSALDTFANEPKVRLLVTTKSNLGNFGETTLLIRGLDSQDHDISNTEVDTWVPWLAAGNAVTVQITVGHGVRPAVAAHTLNHEISLHGIPMLRFIRSARAYGEPKAVKNLVEAFFGKDLKESQRTQHNWLARETDQRLIKTHKAMKKAASKELAETLEKDYQKDVEAHAKDKIPVYVPPHRRNL